MRYGGGISLSKKSLTLEIGQSETLTAEYPDGAELLWSSDNELIATVTQEGVVTAVSAGSCTVTAVATTSSKTYSADCAVTVTAPESVSVTFVADGTTVSTLDVAYGGSVSESDIPAVPEKSGYSGSWDKTASELSSLTSDVTVTAVYKLENVSYTLEVYVQNGDLTYTRESAQTLSGTEGDTVSADAQSRDGYLIDEDKSVLSATLASDGSTVLSIYYALPYKSVMVVYNDLSVLRLRVYDEAIANTEGNAVTASDIALTENDSSHYYFWEIDGYVLRELTDETLLALSDGATVWEKCSSDSLFNTDKDNYGFTISGETYSTSNLGWKGAYLYFTGSSDTFYVKIKTENLKSGGDTDLSAGFTIADANDPDKNVQIYFAYNYTDSTGCLNQNNSYGWESNETVYALIDSASWVLNSDSNTYELVISEGWLILWLNGSYVYSGTLDSLMGYGNTAGLFSSTTAYDVGIAQWCYAHYASFTVEEFALGSDAETYIAAKMPTFTMSEESLSVKLNAGVQTLTLSSSYGSALDLSEALWSSSNEEVVTVEGGAVTLVGAGTATVTASFTFLGESYSATCEVTVLALDVYTITFVANGETVTTLSVTEGDVVSADDVPAVPAYNGASGVWDIDVTAIEITSDLTVTAGYSGLYTVSYYKENAKTGVYELYDEISTYTSEDTATVTPDEIDNYTVNTEKSVLSAAVSDTPVALSVYYDLVVKSVTVTIDGTAYTAYYELGLYSGENEAEESVYTLPENYFWKVNGVYDFDAVYTAETFYTLLEGVTLVKLQGSNTYATTAKATVSEDGSVVYLESSGWSGAYAYFNGSGTVFYAQTTIAAYGDQDDDLSAGITVMGSDGKSFQIYIAGGGIKINFIHRWEGNGTVEQTSRTLCSYSSSGWSTRGVTMGLAYQDGTFYLYLDGELIYTFGSSELTYIYNSESCKVTMGDGWTVGIASWNTHKPQFTGSFVVFDESETQAYIDLYAPSLSISDTNLSVKLNAGEQTLTVSSDNPYVTVVWSSSNEEVVTVDGGIVTLVSVGTATITASYTLGEYSGSATCEVTVLALDVYTITFVANGETVTTLSVTEGDSVSADDVPAVPAYNGASGVWDIDVTAIEITSDLTVTAGYSGLYTVSYYKENAMTGTYELFNEVSTYTEEETASVTPEMLDNYMVNETKSVLSAAVSDTPVALSVYYDLVVKSVTVTIDGTEYTAYYALGLYAGENEASESVYTLAEGKLWSVNGTPDYSVTFTADDFVSLTESLTLATLSVSELAQYNLGTVLTGSNTDIKNLTYSEEAGTFETSTNEWSGTYAYLNGVTGSSFYAQTTITISSLDPDGEDNDVSAGITVKGSDGTSFQIYIGYSSSGYSQIHINFYHRWKGDGTVEQTSRTLCTLDKLYTISDGVTMGLGYRDGTFYLYLDGELIYTFDSSELTYTYNSESCEVTMGDGWTVGIANWAYNHYACFSDSFVAFFGD